MRQRFNAEGRDISSESWYPRLPTLPLPRKQMRH